MEKYSQLFNQISKDEEWLVRLTEDKKLELRLGPPGEDRSPIFFGYRGMQGAKTAFEDTFMSKELAAKAEDSSKPCSSRVAELQCLDKKEYSSLSASVTANTSMTIGSNERTALAPVVGWPPVGSFRKNLGNSSLSKPASKLPHAILEGSGGKSESFNNNLFVKINMEGVPIGRKVNLSVYNSYEELSFAIDELFQGLLAAQRVPPAAGNENKTEELEMIVSSVAESDEYTLVYEDNEGDRMLVGDVPWHMFISTVKKLLVLKSSELSTLRLSQKRVQPLDYAMEMDHEETSNCSNYNSSSSICFPLTVCLEVASFCSVMV